jgi:hypothetical protein
MMHDQRIGASRRREDRLIANERQQIYGDDVHTSLAYSVLLIFYSMQRRWLTWRIRRTESRIKILVRKSDVLLKQQLLATAKIVVLETDKTFEEYR